jgi:hypothetical protein
MKNGLKNNLLKIVSLFIVIFLTFACHLKNSSKQNEYEKWWLDPNTLPEWAQPGKVRCSRWDGGPIEAEKGRLSGWPFWEEGDPEGVLKTTDDFYDLKTIEWIKRAGFNWVWITWSNGFSHETESKQWEILLPYIKECHRNGIKVTAYLSGANMFKEDMLKYVPGSKEWWKIDSNGEPVPYGSANYNKYGITRYMANIQHPDWLPYQRVRIRKALEAGIDGFWVDNIGTYRWSFGIKQLTDLIMEESKRSGVTPVVNFNLHRGSLVLGRYMNSLATEDGLKPGIYNGNLKNRVEDLTITAREKNYSIAEMADTFVCNIGLLKYLNAVSEGWRSICLENGVRDIESNRLTDYMTPELWQLSLAECQMYQSSQVPFIEGIFARDLSVNNNKAFECLDAIGSYNRFFDQNSQYFSNPVTVASIAVIGQSNGSSGIQEDKLITYLNRLSTFDIQYDVLLDIDISGTALSRYKIIALMDWIEINEIQAACLKQWVLNGGTLLVYGDKSDRVQMLQIKIKDEVQTLGKGKIYFSDKNPSPNELSEEFKTLETDDEIVQINAPYYILHHTVKQQKESRAIVHLINYSQQITSGIEIVCKTSSNKALVLSPDLDTQQIIEGLELSDDRIKFRLPEIKIYYIVVLLN